ncbi:hypothetical protein K7X08_033219 [Anisodus acutangulus]|uniref:Uncharacterized protein n=1 Tax=Anisodus acutangulus TaxID=402998 RepID=A0A9Q1RD12_9SOLA|nr:hypothetical protein K7X08_033219 [Anisodus acutangulus]
MLTLEEVGLAKKAATSASPVVMMTESNFPPSISNNLGQNRNNDGGKKGQNRKNNGKNRGGNTGGSRNSGGSGGGPRGSQQQVWAQQSPHMQWNWASQYGPNSGGFPGYYPGNWALISQQPRLSFSGPVLGFKPGFQDGESSHEL